MSSVAGTVPCAVWVAAVGLGVCSVLDPFRVNSSKSRPKSEPEVNIDDAGGAGGSEQEREYDLGSITENGKELTRSRNGGFQSTSVSIFETRTTKLRLVTASQIIYVNPMKLTTKKFGSDVLLAGYLPF
ncbi:unnamed protein product [Cyclocybe aegerita]|uniref:Uncharacterized protein n=1 Tax=Cyclocybe aegerita TaxID=1973307 RepID=A0A8S0XTT4_CYCAE|nr:unnamed protein product [Cyclocybe aegerita]